MAIGTWKAPIAVIAQRTVRSKSAIATAALCPLSALLQAGLLSTSIHIQHNPTGESEARSLVRLGTWERLGNTGGLRRLERLERSSAISV